MMGDFRIDPYAWLLTLPLTLAMVWLYVQPAEHYIKQVWRDLMMRQEHGWMLLTGRSMYNDEKLNKALFWVGVWLLAFGTLASLDKFITSAI